MSEPVNIRILDREFTVGCEPGEREGLLAAAALLDSRMREIRGNNRMAAVERVAMLAALNLAHDYRQLKLQNDEREQLLSRTLGDLNRRLDGLFDAPR
ncbi:MAG TPA: cell division protein ZapA [Arenimonas sp.]|nr:cell division protein ZapA [Arenimonas sp.]